MKRFNLFVFLVLLGGRSFALSSVFETLQNEFSKAHAPIVKKALGAWSGFCVHAHEPNQKWPSVYVHQGHINPQTNLDSFSQTYFWQKKDSPHYFSHFTWEQLNQYQPYLDWAKKEQWKPTEIVNDSLTNYFDLPNGGTIVRSVRVSETEFSQTLLLEIRRETIKGTETLSQCSFHKPLAQKVSSPQTPTVSVQTGPLSNTYAEIKFPLQERRMEKLIIEKPQGERVILSRVEVIAETGQIFVFQPIQFPQGNAMALEFPQSQRLHAVRFFVEGQVSNLWIYGLTSPSHRLLEALVP